MNLKRALALMFAALLGLQQARGAFRFETVENRTLKLWEDQKPVLAYNFGEIRDSAVSSNAVHSAYIHPLHGLDGEILTGDFPKDHPYHRGLYWAWSHIQIQGKEYDSWSVRGIKTEFRKWLAREAGPKSATISAENEWMVQGKAVMNEVVRIDVHPAQADARAIDLALTWTPLARPITLSGAPGKSYGGLTLRFGSRSKTLITTPAGLSREDLLMTKLPWADLTGDLAGKGAPLSGAAVFVSPDHPDFPPTWMTREYGVLAVGWPGVTPKTFQPGEKIAVKYRIWIHRGLPEKTELDRAFDAYKSGR